MIYRCSSEFPLNVFRLMFLLQIINLGEIQSKLKLLALPNLDTLSKRLCFIENLFFI